MIINAFKNKIFPLSTEESFFEDADRDKYEDDDNFYTPKQLKPILEFHDFENEEETPRDISKLESEKYSPQRRKQKAKGLKILTPQQMLSSRLLISLAQLKAGNNSEKLKNGIRQLLYSLYRSKKLSKIIYDNLINTI